MKVHDVPIETRRIAALALGFGCRDLGIGPVTIRWYDRAPSAPATNHDDIWIRRDLDARATATAVLRELRRLAWRIEQHHVDADSERLAVDYANRMAREIMA
jgi:hypothetical protein